MTDFTKGMLECVHWVSIKEQHTLAMLHTRRFSCSLILLKVYCCLGQDSKYLHSPV